MDMSKAVSGRFLKCSDLNGESKTLEIERVEYEMVGQGEDSERKYVVYFRNEKPFVLNKCNTEELIKLHGKESKNWDGMFIEAYPTTTNFGGKQVDCVRLREAAEGALPF